MVRLLQLCRMTFPLIVPLMSEGLVQLSTPISQETHEILHSALPVWLASKATVAAPSVHAPSVLNCNMAGKAYHSSLSEMQLEDMVIGDVGIPPRCQVGFRVNGMLQTIQKGKLVILRGVVEGVDSCNILYHQDYEELKQVSQYLDSSEILVQVFSTFFMLSEDIESFSRHVAFHCFSLCDLLVICPSLNSKGTSDFTVIGIPFSSLKQHDILCAFFMRISQDSLV